MKQSLKILCAMTLICALNACRDHVFVSSVPSFPVQFELNIWGEYPHFVVDNGFQTLTFTQRRFDIDYLGYAGLLIWVDMGAQYNAADLCCPNCLDREHPLTVDGIYAVCEKCGEQYDLSFGTAHPIKGVAHETLRKYTVTYANGRLLVSN